MKHLYRSRTNRIIAGVCGGIGEYFDIDPVIIRIAWVAMTIFGGMSILAYIIAWIIIPDEKTKKSVLDDMRDGKKETADDTEIKYILGLFLVFLGIAFLLSNLNVFFWSWGYTWPALLIILGIIVILSRRKSKK